MGEPGTSEFVKAAFIEDVGKYMEGKQFEMTMLELQQRLRYYKVLEAQIMTKKGRLTQKLPEIQKTLDIVNALIKQQDTDDVIVADFELTEGVYAKAQMQQVQSVNLWLGAGVMVEYPLEEAQQLLTKNLANCKTNLATHTSDLEMVRESRTITEVSIARVFNWDVEQRRKGKESAASES
eukprot:jgi/Chrzof1/15208/Cz09g31200.t1